MKEKFLITISVEVETDDVIIPEMVEEELAQCDVSLTKGFINIWPPETVRLLLENPRLEAPR